MNRCLLAIGAATMFLFGASSESAEIPPNLCKQGQVSCEAFVGLLPDENGAEEPARGGERRAYWIAGEPIVMDRFEAWRAMRCLAYVAWAEGRSGGISSMHGVMWVVMNRTAAWGYPHDICRIVARKGQFEPMHRRMSRPWLKAALDGSMPPDIKPKTAPDARAARIAKALAWHMLTGHLQHDPTGGATHFVAVKTQLELGRSLPAWASEFQQTGFVGEHLFYKAVEIAEVPR